MTWAAVGGWGLRAGWRLVGRKGAQGRLAWGEASGSGRLLCIALVSDILVHLVLRPVLRGRDQSSAWPPGLKPNVQPPSYCISLHLVVPPAPSAHATLGAVGRRCASVCALVLALSLAAALPLLPWRRCCRSPNDPSVTLIRRLIGMEGDWVAIPGEARIEKLPKVHNAPRWHRLLAGPRGGSCAGAGTGHRRSCRPAAPASSSSFWVGAWVRLGRLALRRAGPPLKT